MLEDENNQLEKLEKAIEELDGKTEEKENAQGTTEDVSKTEAPESESIETGNGDEKTDEGKSEKEQSKESQKQKEQSEEIDGISEDAPPNKENFKKLREGRKRDRELLREAQGKLKELESKQQSSTPVVKTPEPKIESNSSPDSKPNIPLDQVLEYYGKGMAGDYGDRSREYVELSKEALDKYSPQELAHALSRANRNGFGEYSEDIAEMLNRQLPVANAFFQDNLTARQQQADRKRQYQESNARAVEKFPGLKDRNSDFSKKFTEVLHDLVGQMDEKGQLVKQGKFPELINYPQSAEILAEQTDLRIRAEEAKKVPDLLKEIETLKQKLENITSPETGGRSPNPRKHIDPDKQELNEIAQEIRELAGQA